MDLSAGAGRRKWSVSSASRDVEQLAESLGVHPVVARLLVGLGMIEVEAARRFLNPSLSHMHDPFLMKDMRTAVGELVDALEGGRRVVVHGDYDVDGVSSTALLVGFLKRVGADVGYFIPRRDREGYGLTPETVRSLHQQGCELLVTVDCGIANVEEVALARSLGMRVVVIDHHSIPEELPPAHALVNPLQVDCGFPFAGLAAVGVAFNVAVALRSELRARGAFEHAEEPDLREMLDLVALGTVADVMPLVDENRVFVRYGLDVIASGGRPGVAALLKTTGRANRRVSAETIGFGLAPRINAAGRVADAAICVELLTTRDPARADELAEELDRCNEERRRREREIMAQAIPLAEEQAERFDSVILLAAKGWDRGVLGIVASRLSERFQRPTLLAAIEGDLAKGSARSIEGVDILAALSSAEELLQGYGGHQAAAGLSFEVDELNGLRAVLNQHLALQMAGVEARNRGLLIDAEVDLGDLDEAFVSDLLSLEPFGEGNPVPLLVSRGLRASRAKVVGEDHLRATFADHTGQLQGIGFSMAGALSELAGGVDVVFSPRYTRFRGRGRLEMHVTAIRPAD